MHLVSLSKLKHKSVFVFLFTETSFNPNIQYPFFEICPVFTHQYKAIGKSSLTTGQHKKNQEKDDESRRHAWTLDMPRQDIVIFGFEKRLPRKNKLEIRFLFLFLFFFVSRFGNGK